MANEASLSVDLDFGCNQWEQAEKPEMSNPVEPPTTREPDPMMQTWRNTAKVLRATANPLSATDIEAAKMLEGAGTLEFCAEQVEPILTDLQTALDASESSRREEAAQHQARVDAVGGEGSYYELAVRLSNVQAENIRLRSELQEMRTLHQIDQRLLAANGASVETPRVPGWPPDELFFYVWVVTMAVTAIVWTWRQM